MARPSPSSTPPPTKDSVGHPNPITKEEDLNSKVNNAYQLFSMTNKSDYFKAVSSLLEDADGDLAFSRSTDNGSLAAFFDFSGGRHTSFLPTTHSKANHIYIFQRKSYPLPLSLYIYLLSNPKLDGRRLQARTVEATVGHPNPITKGGGLDGQSEQRLLVVHYVGRV